MSHLNKSQEIQSLDTLMSRPTNITICGKCVRWVQNPCDKEHDIPSGFCTLVKDRVKKTDYFHVCDE